MRRTLFFEGGLGSQLISAMTYMVLTEKQPLICDFTYFKCQDHKANPDLSFWDWQLEAFGIKMDDFPQSHLSSNRRFRGTRKISLSQGIINQIKARNLCDRFPLTDQFKNLQAELEISNDEKFACIHIRQGDYLNVAARVISLQEVVNSVLNLEIIMPKRIFLISDSSLSENEIATVKMKLKKHDLKVLIGGNVVATHGLMRNASLLVTSNSTFSFSAMLLAEKPQISITPNNFHGSNNEKLNTMYTLHDSWSINFSQ
jgi:hypothetical protein